MLAMSLQVITKLLYLLCQGETFSKVRSFLDAQRPAMATLYGFGIAIET